MKIINHRLVKDDGTPIRFVDTPNKGGAMTPEFLVMHYTAGSSAEGSVAWMCNPAAKSAAHLVIGRDGGVTQLAAFNRVAWHAGQSQWAGRSGLNGFSIGIELEGLEGHPFEAAQYQALTQLAKSIAAHYPLKHVAGHEHIAPGRKADPGAGFDWAKFQHLTAWPQHWFPEETHLQQR